MIEETLLKYKDKLKKEQEQPFLNKKIDEVLSCLESDLTFKDIKEEDIKDLLLRLNYDASEISKILMTLKYAKLNNSYSEYKDLFKNIFQEFLYLKHQSRDLSTINYLLENVNAFLEILKSDDLSFRQEHLNFFLKIVEEENLDMEIIILAIKEIDEHNKIVYEHKKRLIEEDDEIDLKTEYEKEVVDLNEFLKEHMMMFSNEEKNILRTLYIESKETVNKNLTYLINTSEFSFIKENLIEYTRLFITLIGYSNIDIMKSIISLSKEYNIDLKELLPTFFVSINHENRFKNTDYEFYNELRGTYEYFVDIIKKFEGIINGKKLIREFSSLLMTDYELIKENLDVLKKYYIPLSDASIKALIDPDLVFKIDRFIEAGLYEYIKNAPSILLNKDDALFYRIKYARKNEIPIKKRFLFKDITDLNGLGINRFNYQEKIEVYHSSEFSSLFYKKLLKDKNMFSSSFDPILNILKEYEIDEVTYQIKGVYISKNKVIRLYESYKQSIEKIPNYSRDNLPLIQVRGVLFSVLSDVLLENTEAEEIVKEILSKFKEHLTEHQFNILKDGFQLKKGNKL